MAGPQLLEGVAGKEVVTLIRQRLHENKLKSEIFKDKNSLKGKILFSVITKNSNWKILPKNLVTFKR